MELYNLVIYWWNFDLEKIKEEVDKRESYIILKKLDRENVIFVEDVGNIRKNIFY